MHPFDIKAALLAKHGQHVALIHFPIALFTMGVLFDFAARWRRSKPMAVAAHYNLLWAGILSVPAVATGLLAWQLALRGARLKGVLLLHLLLGVLSSLLLLVVSWLYCRAERSNNRTLFRWLTLAELAGIAVLTLTGHLGGFLSGVNGAP